MANNEILPGATIGILGDGQLGKMSAMAAAQLGCKVAVLGPGGRESPAGHVTYWAESWGKDPATVSDEILDQFCRDVSVVTLEWENVPLALLERIEQRGVPVRPSRRVLEIAQSRWKEKQFAWSCNAMTVPTLGLPPGTDVSRIPDVHNHLPGILKTERNGYDGKGQWQVNTLSDLAKAFTDAGVACVLEKKIALNFEMSIVVARNARGEVVTSNVVENEHEGGILSRTIWNQHIRAAHFEEMAKVIATTFAEYLELEGILALEFFVSGGLVYFNEMAPRPHNSFHASIEAAYTSQFEQHIRAISNLPLGNLTFHTPFEMQNLIGGSWENDWRQHLGNPNARLHLYGKTESRPDRKMGHVTLLVP